MSEAVKVIVRCRPINKREIDLKSKTVVQIDSRTGHCDLLNPIDDKVKSFVFDGAYSPDSTTEQIYNEIVFPLVESVTEGYNATVFAYGQTGSGKSFTMQGSPAIATQRGIIPRSFEHIFESISVAEHYKFLIHASYLEIYNEEIRDLLGEDVRNKLELKEHTESGVYVNELSLHPIHNVRECEQLMEKGWKNRSVGSTLMNADSSRSHSIFTLYVERMQDRSDGEECNSFFKRNMRKKEHSASSIRRGKLNLVDLAGSERQAKTGATGDRFKEATKINLSLSALGNVISALVDGKQKYIPFRDSKLTRLLQDSLGGNTKTLMVACLSPSDNNYDETLSTLRYANRAKSIQNKPRVNEDPKDALLREYQEEIAKLRTLLDNASLLDKATTKQLNGKQDSTAETIKEEYDRKIEELVNKYKEERENHEKLKGDLVTLKQSYEDELKRKNSLTGDELTNQNVTTEQKVEMIKNNMKQGELLIKERLKELENQMIGGEKANDLHLKEKRANRKKLAEAKINAIKDALQHVDDEDNMLIKAYGDITEELKSKNQLLKKAKKRLTCLEQDVKDLQGEFEVERTDYLETIRKQEQQTKLLNQLIEKFQQIVQGKDVNYANLERIKKECWWDTDNEIWHLPDVIYHRTKLPPAEFKTSNDYDLIEEDLFDLDEQVDQSIDYYNGSNKNFSNGNGTNNLNSKDRLFKKLEKNVKDNLAGNYFKPKRQEQLLNHVQTYLSNSDENNNRIVSTTNQSESHGLSRKVNESGENSINCKLIHPKTTKQDRAKSFLITTLNSLNKNADDLNGSSSFSAETTKRKPSRLESIKMIDSGNR